MSHVISSRELTDVKRYHFRGPVSGIDNEFRTLPSLLRRVADWIDETGLQDPEFQGLSFHVEFVEDSDDYYLTATLHYANEPTQAVTAGGE